MSFVPETGYRDSLSSLGYICTSFFMVFSFATKVVCIELCSDIGIIFVIS
jgi:hypothetical protein